MSARWFDVFPMTDPIPKGPNAVCESCGGDGTWHFGNTEHARFLASCMPCPDCYGKDRP